MALIGDPMSTLTLLAATASTAMQSFVKPTILTLGGIASLVCVFFLVNSGVQYMASTGKPDKLEQAKKTIKNALIGLALIIGAGAITGILSGAYSSSASETQRQLPNLETVQTANEESGLIDVLVNAVVGLLRNIVQSIGEPFLGALSYFINSTPLMGDNSSVFTIWLVVVGIADALFVLVVALLGFHVMSFSTLGFDDIDLKELLPQMALIFLVINTSIFAIDAIIKLSNAMIYALHSGFPSVDLWALLAEVTKQSTELGLAGLLVMAAFLTLTVMLLIFYIGRLITLYLGAILSPLIALVWLLPAFKDFAIAAFKTYLTTIFVLFVHVVILLLAASLFIGLEQGSTNAQPNTLMALLVGMATVIALLKAQGVMRELSYAASAPRAARELGSQFIRGVSSLQRAGRSSAKSVRSYQKRSVVNQESAMVHRLRKSAARSKQGAAVKPLKTGETRKAERIE